MKNLVLGILAILLASALIFSGCTSSPPSQAPTTTAAPTTAAPATTPAAAPIILKVAEQNPPTQPDLVALQDWAKKIEEQSNGRVKFQWFFGGSLMAQDQTYTELQKGTADISNVTFQFNPTGFPMYAFVNLLFYGCKNTAMDAAVYWQLDKEFPEVHKDWADFISLAPFVIGPSGLHSTKPVSKLADFKGLKIRPIGTWLKGTLTKVGAIPTGMAGAEIYTSLQKGIIDGDIHPYEFLKSYKTGEVEPYTTELGLFDGASQRYCMNKDSFNKLPADIQKMIIDSIPWLIDHTVEVVDEANKNNLAWAKSLPIGHQVLYLSPEDQATFNKYVAEETLERAKEMDAKGFPGNKILQRARELIEKP